jgi:hypothetical protein
VGWLRRHYGAGPLHLAGSVACFAVAGYAVTRVLGQSGWLGIFLWFVACIVLHDLIGWPIYTAADRFLARSQHGRVGTVTPLPPGAPSDGPDRRTVPWVNHVRFPVAISGLLLVMFFPLVLRVSNKSYEYFVGYSEDAYLTNWLVVTGLLCVASALVYAVRLGLARRGAH